MHSCMMARKPSLNMEHGFLKAIRRQLLQDAEGHGLQPADVSSRCDTHAASQTSVQVAAVPVHREPGALIISSSSNIQQCNTVRHKDCRSDESSTGRAVSSQEFL